MPLLKVLVTGVSGYVGGSVLAQLQISERLANSRFHLTGLVRSQNQADILAKHGIESALIDSLDDIDHLTELASTFDVVIHCASGFHTASAQALIHGLHLSMKQSGRQTFYIHTTGTSNLAERRGAGDEWNVQPISDLDDVYEKEKQLQSESNYAQRMTDIIVIEDAAKFGVKAYLMMPPTIYGQGLGLFNKESKQVPFIVENAFLTGHATFISDGSGGVGYVHIEDLARLYELIFVKILNGDEIPSGERGIYFSNTGEFKWKDLAVQVGEVGSRLGALESPLPVATTLEDASQKWGVPLDIDALERNFAAKSHTIPELAYTLGWQPAHTSEDWSKDIESCWKNVLDKHADDLKAA